MKWLYYIVLLTAFISSDMKADERILSFHSDIQISIDGSMQVKETILFRAENNQIKRGIYRDFPTHYKDRLGNNYQVKFEVQKVLRDGQAESFHTESKSNGIRLYLGNEDYLLPVAEYTYSIIYHTDRQLGYFADHDELYWNSTGNGWIFPIDKVTVEVHLPNDIPSENITLEAYTGPTGAKGSDYQAMINQQGNAQFISTRTLMSYEGLTIVTAWPKGFIKKPDVAQNLGYLLDDNFSLLLGLVGLLIVLFYYLWVWNKVGKDPEAGVIFPHYSAPNGFSPASMRYISRMGYDHKTFATAIVNLAVKGALTINESSKKYSLTLLSIDQIELAAGEQVLLKQLFSKGNTVKLENTNHSLISKSIHAHKRSLKQNYNKIYFNMNSVWLLPGFLISIGFIAAIFLTVKSTAGPENLFLLLWLTAWTTGVVALTATLINFWRSALSGKGYIAAILLTLFVLPFFAAEVFVIWKFNFSLPLVLTVATIISMNMLFFKLLKAPTRAGRKLLDKIDGFKMYLNVAEKDELNLKNPPEKTPAIFEAFLASAMALDVEQRWAEKFASVFASMQQTGQDYQPVWYQGSHWNSYNLGGFTAAVGNNLSSAISSSSTAPVSSSGSGGGGSSGGGGGGGGGGGW